MRSAGDTRPVALITGASSGIGLALAARLGQRYRMVLAGRRAEREVAAPLPPGSTYIQADLAQSQGTLTILQALDGVDRLDLAVLNAGLGTYGGWEREVPAAVTAMIDVNLTAPITLARALCPRLEAAGGGLVLIGSTAHRGAARMPTYAATKAGIDGFARSLREEWRGRIAVQVIHPGPTVTEMHRRAGFEPGRLNMFFASSEAMAQAIERAIERGTSPVRIGPGAMLRQKVQMLLKRTKR